ncbi:MAG: hypothetical protein HC810_00415 [Acaryochloridaceae cyanobacterium RL_2_7]|nr:hypothetical protein [Acaryochloridaceae cyanobacterium RL_2_7]
MDQYREDLKQSLDDAIAEVLERRYRQLQSKRNPLTDAWLKGLYLFHCRGESMGDIAHKIGLKAQYQVSRLLQLKAMRADIRQAMLQILAQRVSDSLKLMLSPERLAQLDRQIETILAEQVDDLLERAAIEASASRNCSHHSLYTRRLCQCLSQRVSP